MTCRFLLVETEELLSSEAGRILACVRRNYKQEIFQPVEVRGAPKCALNHPLRPTNFRTPIGPFHNPTHGRALDSLRLITRELPSKNTITSG